MDAFYLSTNYGSTWTKTGSAVGASFVWSFAASGTTVLAATVGLGVYRSTDAGSSWRQSNNGLTEYGFWTVAWNGVTAFAGSATGKVFRSTDGGSSWTLTSTGLPAGIIQGLAFVGSDVYALYRSGAVYLSVDNGANWAMRGTASAGNSRSLYAVGTKLFVGSSSGGAYWSTDNGATWTPCPVLSGGVRSFTGTSSNLLAGTGLGVYRSTDNGANWAPTGASWSYGMAWGLSMSGGYVFGASDVGLVVSANNGATWSVVSDQWRPITFQAVEGNGTTLFGGWSTGMYSSSDVGTNWNLISGAAVALLLNGGKLFAGSNGVVASTDNGTTWVRADSGMIASAPVYQNALAVNGANMFAGTSKGTYRSTNSGVFWDSVNSGLVSAYTGACGFAFVGSTVFAGTFDRGVYRSTNNGNSWTRANTGLTDTVIYALCASGTNVFAASQSGGVFRSTNSGGLWTQVNTGLPPFAVNQFVVSGSQIYAATLGDGIYVSNDNGGNWTSAGPSGQVIQSLAVAGTNLFVAGTGPNSYWRPLSEMNVQAVTFQADLSQLLLGGFNPATDSIVLEGDFNFWTGTHKMTRVGLTSIWQETVFLTGPAGDSLAYKFRAFPTNKFSNNGWESDPNRYVVLTGSDQTLIALLPRISYIPPILNDVTAMFEVDMNGAVEVFGGTAITNVRSLWMAGDTKPLQWPMNGWTFPDTASSMIRMYDDGTHGDPVPGDGVWTTTITFLKSDTARRTITYKYAANYVGVQSLNGGIRYLDNELGPSLNHITTLVDSAGAFPMVYFSRFGLTPVTVFADSTAPAAPRTASISPNTWSSTNQFTITWTNPPVPTGVTSAWYTIDVAPTASTTGTQSALSVGPSIQVSVPSVGAHTIYVYLGNGVGKKNPATAVALKAKFDNISPQVTHDSTTVGPVQIQSTGALVGSPPSITASGQDSESGIRNLTISYKRSSDNVWATQTYASSGTLPIPSNQFTLNSGVEYQITATDSAGNKKARAFSIAIQIVGNLSSPATLLPAASSQSGDKTMAYRMISVPYDILDQTPLTVLTSLGPHEKDGVAYANWRLWRMDMSPQDYEGFKTDNAFQPGKAYFLIVNDANQVITIAPGKLVSARKMYETGIQLQTGWNSVGDPFPFNLPYDSLFTFPAGVITGHAYFSGTTSGTNGWELNTGGASTLRAWEGLAIKVSQPAMLRFRTGLSYLGKIPAASPSVAVLPEAIVQQSKTNCLINAKAIRTDNGLGVNDLIFGYADNLPPDPYLYNWPSPPLVINDGVAAYFRENDEELVHDIHAPSTDGDQWSFHLRTRDEGARVKLDFDNVDGMTAAGWKLYLLDLDGRTAYDLKVHPSVTVGSGSGERNFRIVAGTEAFVSAHADGIALLPVKAVLSQNYPNPFNPSTVLRYSVPDAAVPLRVQLKVFNILGQVVATLVDKVAEAGYYEQEFNAHGLASGIYICRMTVTESGSARQVTAESRKMVLLR